MAKWVSYGLGVLSLELRSVGFRVLRTKILRSFPKHGPCCYLVVVPHRMFFSSTYVRIHVPLYAYAVLHP